MRPVKYGDRVRKWFPPPREGFYLGTVGLPSLDPTNGQVMWAVHYDDDDFEHMSTNDVLSVRIL